MNMLLPEDCPEICTLIFDAAENDATVAELEYLGLSNRIINTLEESEGIVYLRDLIELSESELRKVRQINEVGVRQIKLVLSRFHLLEKEKRRWNCGSERLDHYKFRVGKVQSAILT